MARHNRSSTLLAQYNALMRQRAGLAAREAETTEKLHRILEETKAQSWWQLGLKLRAIAGRLGLKRRTPRFPYDTVPSLMAEREARVRRAQFVDRVFFSKALHGNTDAMAAVDDSLPLISVVSAIYNKEEALCSYLAGFSLQSYAGPVELVLVDDVSTDSGPELIERFTLEIAPDFPGLSVRLLRNESNLGNCASRNRGIAEARGEILIIMDADCFPNPDFAEAHWRAHARGTCDVCIGPMDIESKGRPLWELMTRLESEPDFLESEMHLQYPMKKDVFLNCVTRNFSITRDFLDAHAGLNPLFDDAFSYSTDPEAGFGWEDIEMGYRCYLAGARIAYSPEPLSIHMSHPPAVDDADKARRAMKNFRRLLDKHADLGLVAPDWCIYTYRRLHRWLAQYQQENIPDAQAAAARIAEWERAVPSRVSEDVHQW